MAIRVVVAHPYVLKCEALGAVLKRWGAEVVGYAVDGREAFLLTIRSRPHLAILAAHLPLLNGIDCAFKIRQECSQTKVVLMTNSASADHLQRALQAGVVAYVRATISPDELIKTLERAATGAIYVDAETCQEIGDTRADHPKEEAGVLTLREREVLQLISEGKSSKEIAALLGISQKTADSHRHRICIKLETHQIAELVHYAVRQGLIEVGLLSIAVLGSAATGSLG